MVQHSGSSPLHLLALPAELRALIIHFDLQSRMPGSDLDIYDLTLAERRTTEAYVSDSLDIACTFDSLQRLNDIGEALYPYWACKTLYRDAANVLLRNRTIHLHRPGMGRRWLGNISDPLAREIRRVRISVNFCNTRGYDEMECLGLLARQSPNLRQLELSQRSNHFYALVLGCINWQSSRKALPGVMEAADALKLPFIDIVLDPANGHPEPMDPATGLTCVVLPTCMAKLASLARTPLRFRRAREVSYATALVKRFAPELAKVVFEGYGH